MQNLKPLRKAQHKTQQQVADALGLDRTTYAKYESGHNEPNIAMIRTLATYFGVTCDYLLGQSDDPTQSAPPVAALGGRLDIPVESLTEAEREEIQTFARYLIAHRKPRKRP